MEVTHATDHITHAIIGGKQSMNFGISDDPAFFQILSSALYKNPELAMVRETICNAWDAHIDAGIADKPLKITFTDNYLIIQDFGNGIPDDLIQPIYGIYGASTKKNDKRQTGGFGLGCKSPFAYTDHFEVTSCHAGKKTIYNMSKSSAELMGKPSIVPIASFPTTDTGITVKIPLNPNKSAPQLRRYIYDVVFNGDILANYNYGGESIELPRIGLDGSEHKLVLLPNVYAANENGHIKNLINVRYGNVIYPVEIADDYKVLFQKCESLLGLHYNCRMVIQAPPDSLSITPSREALTNSDITIATISNLLGKFLSIFMKNQQLLFRHTELLHEYVDAAADKDLPFIQKLPLAGWSLPGIPEHISSQPLFTTDDFAKLEVKLRYSSRKPLKAKKWLMLIQRYFYRINEDLTVFDRGVFQSWARTFQRTMKKLENPTDPSYSTYAHCRESPIATQWWLKQILVPLQLKLAKIPNFDRKRMYYTSSNYPQHDYYARQLPVRVNKVAMSSHTQNLIHLLKPVVVLTHNAENLMKRITNIPRNDPIHKHLIHGFYVYEISRKQAEVDGTKQALMAMKDIHYIDLTGRTAPEEEAYQDRQKAIADARAEIAAGRVPKTKVVKKVKAGFITLANLIEEPKKRVNAMIFTEHLDPVRIDNPKAVVQISMAKERLHEAYFIDSKAFYYAALMYGGEVAVSNKSDAVDRIKKKTKAVELRDYLFDRIIDDVQNSPSLVAYQSSDINKMIEYIREKTNWQHTHQYIALIKLLVDYPELNSLAPDVYHLSDEDKMKWYIWTNLENISYDRREEYRKVRAIVHATPLKPEIIKFLDKMMANTFLALINIEEAVSLMQSTKQDPAKKKKFIELLTSILQ